MSVSDPGRGHWPLGISPITWNWTPMVPSLDGTCLQSLIVKRLQVKHPFKSYFGDSLAGNMPSAERFSAFWTRLRVRLETYTNQQMYPNTHSLTTYPLGTCETTSNLPVRAFCLLKVCPHHGRPGPPSPESPGTG